MKTILVLCGIPGSGKSTLAENIKKLAKNLSVQVVSSDVIRLELNGTEDSQDNPAAVWSKFYDDAFLALTKHDIVILDATFAKRRDRTVVHKLFGHSARLVCIHLDPPFLVSSRQNETRARVVPALVLEKMAWGLTQTPPIVSEGFHSVVTIKSSKEIFEKWQNIMI